MRWLPGTLDLPVGLCKRSDESGHLVALRDKNFDSVACLEVVISFDGAGDGLSSEVVRGVV